jgi:glycine hydroxymethyltransferase
MDMSVMNLINEEEKRQTNTLTLIPSENYASGAVRLAMGSVFANKYAEGYPGKRYYQGNRVVDELERECQEAVKKLFGVPHVNVQPWSGAAANLAILWALRTSNEDVQLSQHLSSGGHLSMGQEVSVTSVIMNPEYYHLTADGEINWKELEEQAQKYRPRIIWAGGTAYTKFFDWKRYESIAKQTGAYFVADISHIGGLVAGGVHPSPVPFADVVMTTTHKSLRGPRGALIMVTEKGLKRDPDLPKKIDKAVFPGVQGGPHMETVAAILVAAQEAAEPGFGIYARQVVDNAKMLAEELKTKGYKLVGGGTENHMVWVDLSAKGIDGWAAAWVLETIGLIANRQTVPEENRSAYYPSGLRLGTPAATTRGMKEKEMKQIAAWIDIGIGTAICNYGSLLLDMGGPTSDKEADQTARKEFKKRISEDKDLESVRLEVEAVCRSFPVPD